MGLGGKADFDATMSDKAISAAIEQIVENIVTKLTDKQWRTYILSADSDGIIIAGGKTQGIVEGDTFGLSTHDKKVKNPQTGVTFELKGKREAYRDTESAGHRGRRA